MDVRLLGQIEAVDGEPLPLGGPTQRRVLAVLALRRNEVVSVSHLVEVIWPDGEPPVRAEHNVRTYVHRLRSSLIGQDDRIETVGAGYRIRLEADEFDAARLEQLAGTASRLAETGEFVAALDLVDEAERLWRGNPIEEFEHEPWAMPDAVRLRELHWELCTQRAAMLIELGRAHDAISSLESLVRDTPLRERPRALLMRALYESGRHAEALRAFQDFRRALIEEIGVEPSKDLVELDRTIATGALASAGDRRRSVGGYELHERIGEGAFAVVHRATQTTLDREVAVKIIRAELANRPEFIRRFEAEAQMVARIEHPNVVPLYDYWREPDRAFLVMRWMTGGSMETRLDDGPWSLDATGDLVEQIADALDAAHQAGVVHRDVKPENILFDAEGRAYLGNFGIALDADERSRPEAALSEGSPIFASPEQLRREPVGPEADVHALAIVAYALLTGRTPFANAPDERTLLQRQLHDPIPKVHGIRPDLPTRIDDVLAMATAKLPADRYPTAPQFALAFRAASSSNDRVIADVGPLRPRANPYKGLRAFDETDTADFHGRARLIDELITHLARPETLMLAVVGPSGSGKSSVVRAGVIPALREGRVPGSSSWFTTAMIPGTRPFESLETALLRVAVNPPAALLEQLRDGDRGILRAVRRILPNDEGVVTIVIDQFEELFTGAVPDYERDLFLRALTVAVTEPASPVRILLTLRADFYDRPLRHPDFAPLLKQHTVVVTPLAPDELEHAIVTPAAAVGVRFEPGLVAVIIADVNHEPGALPLLQYALTQAFDATGGDTITIDAYRSIGSLTGALARRAEELWQAADIVEQLAARHLFGRLVTLGEGAEDTRRRVRRSELGGDHTIDGAIDRYGNARLLSFDHDPASREPTVEIAHEALIREWPRLRDWLDDYRDNLRTHRHLTSSAVGWAERDRDLSELYRGARLTAAEPLLTANGIALNEVETEFLRAGVERRDAESAAERQRVRRLRRLVTATAVVAVIALSAGAVALVQWRHANDQAASAEASALRSDVDRLISQARNADITDPTLGILLGIEAHRIAPSFTTTDALHWALTARPTFVGSLDTGAIGSDIDVLADGEQLLIHTRDTVEIWNAVTRSRLMSWPTPAGTRSPFDVRTTASSDGTVVAVAGASVTEIVDGRTGEIRHRITHTVPASAVGLSPDADRLALGFFDGSAVAYDIGGRPEEVAVLDWGSRVNDIEWLPDGATLAIGGDDGAGVWSIYEDAVRWRINGEVVALLISSDGDRLVLSTPLEDVDDDEAFFVSKGRAVRVLATDTGVDETEPIPHEEAALHFGWADRSENIVVGASWTGPITRFDIRDGTQLPNLGPSPGRGEALAVLPELGLVASAGNSSVELQTLDGSGPLSRLAVLTPGQRAAGQPFLTGAFDETGETLVTAAFLTPEPPQRYDLTAERLEPAEFSHVDGSILTALVRSGPYTTQVILDEGFEVRRDLDGPTLGPLIPLAPGFHNSLSPRGDRLALQSGRKVKVFEVATGDELYQVDDVTAARFAVPIPQFSPSGAFLHVWNGSTASRFDAETGDLIWSTPNWGYVYPGPDDRWVATAEVDGSIQLREPATMEAIGAPLIGHVGLVTQFFFNSATALAVTAADDSVTRVWDTKEHAQLGRELPAITGSLRFWSPDGSQLALPVTDGYIIWNYDAQTWTEVACDVVGRNLTRGEWEKFGPRTVDYRATCDQYAIES